MNDLLETFAADLIKYSSAEVYTDQATRLLYSTDASIYQIMPLAVVVPRHYDDVLATVELCIREGLPMLPRGGGSSLAGQTVGEAVVIDFTKYLDQVIEIDGQRRRVLVQAGTTLDVLNRQLSPYALTIGPDPASSARAAVGGIIGNNATGSHSLVYGHMADHVVSLRSVLADGKETRLGPVAWENVPHQGRGDDIVSDLYRQIPMLIQANAQLINDQFPKYWRRSGGYNIDRIRRQLEGDHLNLASLLVGSEGTLGITLEAELDLVAIPSHKILAILHFDDSDTAFRAVPGLLELNPSAIEYIDEVLMRLTRQSPSWSKHLTFVEGEPAAVFVVEFCGEEETYLADRFQALEQHLNHIGYRGALLKIIDSAAQANVWEVRKAGLNLLTSMRGDAKPVPGIEDVAVPPENLADYMAELGAMLDGRGLLAAMYAHASAGCIHTRPILNLKSTEGISTLIELITGAATLAKKYGGVPSSEHGDGLARSFLNPGFFGPDMYDLFRQVKSLFDPDHLFNPGKIVDPQPPDQNLRYGPDYETISIDPIWDWSNDGSYSQAVEMCNGSGVCRRLDVGSMCPSFQATRDEMHSTRGRANLLRVALTGDLPGGLADPALAEALDLCLGCKACKTECPSSVDMTKLKAEASHQKYRTQSPPLSARAFANIDHLSALAAPFAPLANFAFDFAPTRWVFNRVLDIHPQRQFPKFQRRTFTSRFQRSEVGRQRSDVRVALFPDTFTQFNVPEQGIAAVRVLEAGGCQVELAPRSCCGRPALSNGLIPEAKARAEKLITALYPYAQADIPVVGLEPSCILTIRDDYPNLLPGPESQAVAENVFLLDEYIAELLRENPDALALNRSDHSYLFHGHCHQKALVGVEPSLQVLAAIPGAQAKAIDAGCCGMAGAFGYTNDHYDVSVAVANDRLIPAISSAAGAIIIANGVSCRHQIEELSGRRAMHLAEALAESLPAL